MLVGDVEAVVATHDLHRVRDLTRPIVIQAYAGRPAQLFGRTLWIDRNPSRVESPRSADQSTAVTSESGAPEIFGLESYMPRMCQRSPK